MFSNILAPVKLTEPERAKRSVEVAGNLARQWDAELTLATITPHWVTIKDADYSWDARRWFEARAAIGLQRLTEHAHHEQCRTLTRWGSIPGSILDIAEEIHADLIILSAQEPALTDLFQRPAAMRIAARSCCSVMLVR